MLTWHRMNLQKYSTVLIILLSLVLFSIRLFICDHLFPDIFSYDFYGYIKLANNIFNHFDFTVSWFLGDRVRYPPLYPILAHLLSFVMKSPIVSMQYINAASASFYIVPLYLLVKGILNKKLAFLSVVFATGFYGLQRPCYVLHMDYFFSFLTITICWLTWLAGQRGKPLLAFGLGVLIGLAYLTRYPAFIYCFISGSVIFISMIRSRCDFKTALKMVLFLALGFLPVFIAYQAVFYTPSLKNRISPVSDIGTYVFFDDNGRYGFESLYKLNPDGTEFDYLSKPGRNNIFKFSLRHPDMVELKYINGFKKILHMTGEAIIPFISRAANGKFYIILPALIFGGGIALMLLKGPDKILLVFLFALSTLGIPILSCDGRYLMPFIPLCFVLCLIMADALFNFLNARLANGSEKIFRLGAAALYTAGIILYLGVCWQQEISFIGEKKQPYREYEQIASWIERVARGISSKGKIMSDRNVLAYLTDSDFIMLPSVSEGWERIIHFAKLKNVDYIILDKPWIRRRLAYPKAKYLSFRSQIRLVYHDQNQAGPMVFKILP
ncbi:MAG: glycosyltransferase family 39 protein [Candidatus Omnitrophica bacterium]|nr:glycosyltransferase family 39 protein [Candidatus Omnitrophota bacterium]